MRFRNGVKGAIGNSRLQRYGCGDETFDVGEGGFIYLPQGIEHGYTIRSNGAVHLLVVTFPTSVTPGNGWGGFIADVEEQGELVNGPLKPDNPTGVF